jgi:hypothetical protein
MSVCGAGFVVQYRIQPGSYERGSGTRTHCDAAFSDIWSALEFVAWYMTEGQDDGENYWSYQDRPETEGHPPVKPSAWQPLVPGGKDE